MQQTLLLVIAAVIAGSMISPPVSAAVIAPLLLLTLYRPVFRLLLLPALTALLWSSCWVDMQIRHRLPPELDRSTASLTLQVESVTEREQGLRLRVMPLQWQSKPADLPELRQMQLNWYQAPPGLQAGARLQADVVLRSPRSFVNGLAFDYTAYLLSAGIDTTGYIRRGEVLAGSTTPLRTELIASVRERLEAGAWPWVAGLVFGQQSAFSAAQWQLAQQSGTLHLLVVSGLHVGFAGWLAWLWSGLLWRASAAIGRRSLAPQLIRLLVMGSFTALYVWLAGYGIALQRAWLMVMVAGLVAGSRWRLDWADSLLWVLAGLLLFNPLLWTRPGLGFSFLAVLALIGFFSGRISPRWQALVMPQWVVFMAMLPLVVLWGQVAGFSHVLANLLAVPLVSLIILPLAFMAALTAWPPLQGLLLWCGDRFWHWLQWVAELNLPQSGGLPLTLLVLWYLLLILLWLGVPRLLSLGVTLLMLAGLFTGRPSATDEVRLTDAGQGLALYFTSEGQALVYDTGARFSPAFDIGSAILLPSLLNTAPQAVAGLIVSHSDQDHAGGLPGFLRRAQQSGLTVNNIWTGQPLDSVPTADCQRSDSGWKTVSGALRWRILVLPPVEREKLRPSDNNASCVVQVEWEGVRFLLPGDLEQDGEAALLAVYGRELRSEVLVAGHHGSRSSSSMQFLRAVQPREVWVSAGFNNRFGHPHPQVMEHFARLNARVFSTAADGALVRKPHAATTAMRHGWQPVWRQ